MAVPLGAWWLNAKLTFRSAGSVRIILMERIEPFYLLSTSQPFSPMAEALQPPPAGHLPQALSLCYSQVTSQCPGSSRSSALAAGSAFVSQDSQSISVIVPGIDSCFIPRVGRAVLTNSGSEPPGLASECDFFKAGLEVVSTWPVMGKTLLFPGGLFKAKLKVDTPNPPHIRLMGMVETTKAKYSQEGGEASHGSH